MNRSERSILAVTVVGHVLCHWSVLIVTGLLVTLKREFGLTEFWVTALPLIGYVLMGAGAIPAGWMTDRWGAKRVLLVYLILTALACVGASVAPSAWALTIALTLLGAAVSLYHPTGLTLISHGIRQRGQALGIHGVAGSIGLAGSPFGLWMASMGNWRAAYAIVAAAALIAAVGLWFLPITLHQETETSRKDDPAAHQAQASPGLKLLILLYLAMMLSGFNYRSLMTALPTYLTAESSGAYATQSGGGVVLTVFLVGGLGQYVSGRYADRVRVLVLYVVLVSVSIPVALMLALSAGVGLFAFTAALGLAFVHFAMQPLENFLIARHSPVRSRGTSYGIKFLVTFGFGAMGAPVVGYLWNKTETLNWTFVLFAAVAVVVTCVLLLVVRMDAKNSVRDSQIAPLPGSSVQSVIDESV